MKKINNEVFYADEQIVKVGFRDIRFLKGQVADTDRKRTRLCAHRDINDVLQEMFIVLAKETYIRPHKHLNKAESLHLIEGLADVIFFDENGTITDVIPIGEYLSGCRFYYRIDKPAYHTLVIHSDVLIFHETTQGPFLRTNTVFAPWAPDENDMVAARSFTEQLSRSTEYFKSLRGE